MKAWLNACWSFLRTLATDDAYERYLAHRAEMHPNSELLDRRAFYLRQQQHKWSGVQRCC